ncbi:DUF5672 family protein [Salegentibacter sp. HM20]
MKVAVVIPVYKSALSHSEELSLKQCLKILGDFRIIFACPKGFDRENFKNLNISFSEFSPDYFKSISDYNRLMLSLEFYEAFLEYEYILLYQLDAFVFRNELLEWCEKGYDYIGAPWLATNNLVSKALKPFQSAKKKKRKPIFFEVGNGGLSLRKTQTFYKITRGLKKLIHKELKDHSEGIYAIEDVFWSLKAPQYYPDFSKPGYKEAAAFALDRKPALGMKILNNSLPFGCHGFEKPKVKSFWEPIIEREASK